VRPEEIDSTENAISQTRRDFPILMKRMERSAEMQQMEGKGEVYSRLTTHVCNLELN
jgi:hypothetical protein